MDKKSDKLKKKLRKSAKIEKFVKTVKTDKTEEKLDKIRTNWTRWKNSDKIEKLDKREHKLTNYNENYLKYWIPGLKGHKMTSNAPSIAWFQSVPKSCKPHLATVLYQTGLSREHTKINCYWPMRNAGFCWTHPTYYSKCCILPWRNWARLVWIPVGL